MNVTILGATGSMGREITSQLIRSRALSRREILQLATNPLRPASRWCAEGIRRDLQDAYAEISPQIQVVENPDDFIGDIIVIAAGATVTPGDFARKRQDLEKEARKVCEYYASRLAELPIRNQVTPIFLIVTNPVEYMVQALALELGKRIEDGARFVIGMGAHSDSLRFQWEIAQELGVVRDRVSAKAVGEHGPLMVPRWSTVQIRGMPEKEQERCLRRIFERDREAATEDFDRLLARRHRDMIEMLNAIQRFKLPGEQPLELLRTIDSYRPDFRMLLKPYVVHHSNSKTAHATGVAAVSLIRAILEGEAITPVVQRMVAPPRAPAEAAFPFGVPTSFGELFRFSGGRAEDPWVWRERKYAAGSFREDRAREEDVRIDRGITAMREHSERWRKQPGDQ